MKRILGLTMLLLAVPAGAHAAILAQCSASTTGIAFSTYLPSSAPVDVTGSISVTCTIEAQGTASFTIGASTGNGSYASRQMNNGSSALAYQLYTDAAHTTAWGDGSAGTSVINGSMTGLPSLIGQQDTVTSNVYARIPAGQWVAPGAYNDTIVVTVTF
jgi:spore coat protein U-like protein